MASRSSPTLAPGLKLLSVELDGSALLASSTTGRRRGLAIGGVAAVVAVVV